MKKLFLILLLATFLLLAWVGYDYFSIHESNVYSGGQHTIINIDASPDVNKPSLEALYSVANKFNTTIECRTYDFDNQEMCIFTSDTNLYIDLLEIGSMPTENDEFVSTKNTHRPEQTGRLIKFNVEYQIDVYNFFSYSGSDLSGEYEIGITDINQVEEFCQAINALDDYNTYYATVYMTMSDSDPMQSVYRKSDFIILFLLILGFVIVNILFDSMKSTMIKKMLGYGNLRLFITQARDLLLACISIYAASSLVCIIISNILSRTSGLDRFLKIYTIFSLCLTGFVLLALFILAPFMILCTRPNDYLKNKKPYRFLITLSSAGKMISILVLFGSIVSVISLLPAIKAHSMAESQWNVLKNYAELPVYEEKSNTPKQVLDLGEQYRTLFSLENERGCILMEPAANLAYANLIGGIHSDPGRPYFLVNNTVTVNNNYLILNPIYDANGEPVSLPDENADILSVLMPEKYLPYEAQFIEELRELANMTYYIQEDFYLEEIGETPEEHTDREIEIIYVRDNQYYFSCNPDYGVDTYHFFEDPICLVVNNVNMGPDTYLAGFSNGDIKVKVPNEKVGLDYFTENIESAGLQNSVRVVKNAYAAAAQKISNTQKYLAEKTCVVVLYLIVFFVLCVIYSSLLIKTQNKTIQIKRLMGYSLLRINGVFYLGSVLFYAIFAVLCRINGAEFTVIQVGIILSLLVIEWAIITITTRSNSFLNQKDQ